MSRLTLIPPVGTKAFERWRADQKKADDSAHGDNIAAHQRRGARRADAIAAQTAIQDILDRAATDAECAAELERYAAIIRAGKWRRRKLRPAKATAEVVITRICKMYQVARRDFHGKCRVRPLVLARRDATWLVWRFTGWNLNEIADYFDVDHATIRHRLTSMERDNPRRRYVSRLPRQ